MCVEEGGLKWDNFIQISNRANILLEMCTLVVIFLKHFVPCHGVLTSYGTKHVSASHLVCHGKKKYRN